MTHIHVYKDRAGKWRWRMKRGGRIVADSGEGYTRKRSCAQSLLRLVRGLCNGPVKYVGL